MSVCGNAHCAVVTPKTVLRSDMAARSEIAALMACGKGDDKETYTIQRSFDQTTKSWRYRIADKAGNGAPGEL